MYARNFERDYYICITNKQLIRNAKRAVVHQGRQRNKTSSSAMAERPTELEFYSQKRQIRFLSHPSIVGEKRVIGFHSL